MKILTSFAVILLCICVGCSYLPEFAPSEISAPSKIKMLDMQNIKLATLSLFDQRPGHLIDWQFIDHKHTRLITVHSTGEVLIWEVKSGKCYLYLQLERTLESARILPTQDLLAFASEDLFFVYSLSERLPIATLSRLKIKPTQLTLESDGDALIIGGADGRVYRWRFKHEIESSLIAEKERSLERYVGHSSVISALAAHPFGRVFFSADWRGNIMAWLPLDSDQYGGEFDQSLFGARPYTDKSNVVKSSLLGGKGGGVAEIKSSTDGQTVVISGERGRIEVFSIRGFERIAARDAHPGLIYSIAISDDGRLIASIGRDGVLNVFEIVPNPQYSSGSSLLRSSFKELSRYSLPEGRKILFIERSRLLIATEDSRLFEVELDLNQILEKPAVSTQSTGVKPDIATGIVTPLPIASGDDY